MNIAIITAMPEETSPLLHRAVNVEKLSLDTLSAFRFMCGGHMVILAEGGMGFENAVSATERIIEQTCPDMIISAGFCGGIAPELRVGDVVIAQRLVIVSAERMTAVTVEIPPACTRFLEQHHCAHTRVFAGLFACTRLITSKRMLAARLVTDNLHPVVEMESAAIAGLAMKHRIPFAGIRTVSDPAGEELGFSLDEFTDNRMRIRPHKVALTILRKPLIIPQLVRLAGNSRIAGQRLAEALEQFIALL